MTIIGKAELATTEVQDRSRAAATLLSDSGGVNSLGVLINPQQRLSSLLSAKAEIEAAVVLLKATSWPSSHDYDDAGY